MDEAEYIRTREQREPILQEILAGYVPKRIDGLGKRLPLEVFAYSLGELSLPERRVPERRDTLVRTLNRVEDSLLVGGCQPLGVFRQGYDHLFVEQPFSIFRAGYRYVPSRLDFRDYERGIRRPENPRILRELPVSLGECFLDLISTNPFIDIEHNPKKLRDYEGLAHPLIFRQFFGLTRKFLDGMYTYLRTYVSDSK